MRENRSTGWAAGRAATLAGSTRYTQCTLAGIWPRGVAGLVWYNVQYKQPGSVSGKNPWIIPQPAQVPMKSHRILAAALLLCSIAACSQTPTGSDRQAQPAGASFDGGGFGMGGGRTDTTTVGTTNTSTTTQDTGGYGMGSGGAPATGGSNIDSGSDTGTQETEPDDAERSGGYGMGSGI